MRDRPSRYAHLSGLSPSGRGFGVQEELERLQRRRDLRVLPWCAVAATLLLIGYRLRWRGRNMRIIHGIVAVLCFVPSWGIAYTWNWEDEAEVRGWQAEAKIFQGGGNFRDLRVEDGILKIKLRERPLSGGIPSTKRLYGARLLSPLLDAEAAWFDHLKVKLCFDRGFVTECSVSMAWQTSCMPPEDQLLRPEKLGLGLTLPEIQENYRESIKLHGIGTQWQEITFARFPETLWWEERLLRFSISISFWIDPPMADMPQELWIDEITLTGGMYEMVGAPPILKEATYQGPKLFHDYVAYDVGPNPNGIKALDVDGDGDIDLVTGTWGGDVLSLLINQGDGTFLSREQRMPGTFSLFPFHRSTDLEGNGHLDLIVSAHYEGQKEGQIFIAWDAGSPDGGEVRRYGRMEGAPFVIWCGDLNGDGDGDFIVEDGWIGSASRWVYVFLNRGDRSFSEPEPYEVGPNPRGVWSGDLDGDGDVDLAVANYNRDMRSNLETDPPSMEDPPSMDSMSILFNRGDGTFGESVMVEVGEHPSRVYGGDEDEDGDMDLMVYVEGNLYGSQPQHLLPLVNDGGGVFVEGTRIYPMSHRGSVVYLSDWDGDGDLDWIATLLKEGSEGEYVASVCINDGAWNFREVVHRNIDSLFGVQWMDVDGDGDQDYWASHREDLSFSVWLNEGAGVFSEGGTYMVSGETFGSVAGDWNGDGYVDMAFANYNGDTVSILLNTGWSGRTDAEEHPEGGTIPLKVFLHTNHPNPFNSMTVIPFDLAFSGRVRLTLYDVLGRKVRTLMEGPMSPGHYTIPWDGRDDAGHHVASGRYLVRLQVGTFSDSKTMTLIK